MKTFSDQLIVMKNEKTTSNMLLGTNKKKKIIKTSEKILGEGG